MKSNFFGTLVFSHSRVLLPATLSPLRLYFRDSAQVSSLLVGPPVVINLGARVSFINSAARGFSTEAIDPSGYLGDSDDSDSEGEEELKHKPKEYNGQINTDLANVDSLPISARGIMAGAGSDTHVEDDKAAEYSVYNLLYKPELSEAEKILVSHELDRRLLNIADTLLGREGIESLERLAKALGADIKQVMGCYFGSAEDLYESIQDLRCLVLSFVQGALVREDCADLARLLNLFKLDVAFLSKVEVEAGREWVDMICDMIKEDHKQSLKADEEVGKLGESADID